MYNNLRKLQDADVENKTIVVRTNFDVPIENDEVVDNTRIQAAVETISYLIEKNCKVVVLSHLGRPEGKEVDELSLMPIRFELGKLLTKPVKFAHLSACENSIKFMEPGEVLMIENMRFNEGEESENEESRKETISKIAELADIYVNEAFGVYRKHASVYDLAKLMNSYAGFQLQKEVEELSKLKENVESPFVCVFGGKKVDTKIEFIEQMTKKADTILIGGALAYTFLKAEGVEVGNSYIEEELVNKAKEILKLAEKEKCEILLPVDHIVADKFEEDAKPEKVDTQHIPSVKVGMDVGPKTLELFRDRIEAAKTILWNGPMGVFEWENFNTGTEAIGEFIALSAPREAFKVAGGGDTTYAMNKLRIKPKRFNHVSIGGGMMMDFIANDQFDVLDVLTEE